jgi:lysozyme family protein
MQDDPDGNLGGQREATAPLPVPSQDKLFCMADDKNSIFYQLIGDILKNEGGYVNNPDDPGGETNFGISKRSYPNIDMKTLTKQKASEIYLADYWNHRYDDLTVGLAYQLFDFGINAGVGRAGKMIQALVVAHGDIIDVDGGFGPATLEAVKKLNLNELEDNMKYCRQAYYNNLVRKKASNKQFLKGWSKRVHGDGLIDYPTSNLYDNALKDDKDANLFRLNWG